MMINTLPVSYSDLVPDIYTQRPLWEHYIHRFIGTSLDHSVVDPAHLLEFIRWLQPQDADSTQVISYDRLFDEETLVNTSRMLGFNLSFDVYSTVKNKVLSHLSQLPLYHQTNGPGIQSGFIDSAGYDVNTSFTRFISYIIGGDVTYHELWANGIDQVHYGSMLQEIPSGQLERLLSVSTPTPTTWFKTTHINLEVDVTRLSAQLRNQDRDGRTFDQRIRELFYAFSPINLVINEVYYNFLTEAYVRFSAGMTWVGMYTYTLGYTKDITAIDIVGPSVVASHSSTQYYLMATYEDESTGQVYPDSWVSNRPESMSISSTGLADTAVLSSTILVTISARRLGVTYTKTISALKASTNPIVACRIIGQELIQESSALHPSYNTYTLEIERESGLVERSSIPVSWKVLDLTSDQYTYNITTDYAYNLAITNIHSDTYTTLTATVVDDSMDVRSARLTLFCQNFNDGDIMSIEICGKGGKLTDGSYDPTELPLQVGQSYQYRAYAIPFVGESFEINPVWLIAANTVLTITHAGVLSVPSDVLYNFETDLIASYVYNNRKISGSTHIVVYPDVYIAELKLVGYGILPLGSTAVQDILNEDQLYAYRAVLQWRAVGSNKIVAETDTPALWYSSRFTIGRETGILHTGIVDELTEFTLEARVDFEGLNEIDDFVPQIAAGYSDKTFYIAPASTTLKINSAANKVTPVSLTLVGSHIIQTPNFVRIYVHLVKSNGLMYSCTPDSWKVYDIGNYTTELDILRVVAETDSTTNSHSLRVEIHPSKYIEAYTHPMVEIEVTHVESGVVLTSRHVLYLMVMEQQNVKIVSFEIVGPGSAQSHQNYEYSAVIHFDNNTQQTVSAQWELKYLREEEDGYVVATLSDNILRTRAVRGDTPVMLKAKYYALRAEKTVVILDNYSCGVDSASCSYLEGPDFIYAGEMASYSMVVYWNDSPNPVRESSDWYLANDQDYKYANIDNEGFFIGLTSVALPVDTPLNAEGLPYRDIIIETVHQCGDCEATKIVKTKTVKLIWRLEDIEPVRNTPCSGYGVLQYVTIYGPNAVDENIHTDSTKKPIYILYGSFVADGGSTAVQRELIADIWEFTNSEHYAAADIRHDPLNREHALMTTEEVAIDTQVVLHACYTDSVTTQSFCDNHAVMIRNLGAATPISIVIVGVSDMQVGDSEFFHIDVNMSDGTVNHIVDTRQWSIPSPPSLPASFNYTVLSNGTFKVTAGALLTGMSNLTFIIHAEWVTPAGLTLKADHPVLVNPATTVLRTVWGYGKFGGLDDAFVTANLRSLVLADTFMVNNTVDDEYVYFCHPVKLGIAEFSWTSSTGTGAGTGAMDGVEWEEDTVDDTKQGPIKIVRTTGGESNEWYLYRSDFSHIGAFTVKVVYS